jgi:hypothetical protein
LSWWFKVKDAVDVLQRRIPAGTDYSAATNIIADAAPLIFANQREDSIVRQMLPTSDLSAGRLGAVIFEIEQKQPQGPITEVEATRLRDAAIAYYAVLETELSRAVALLCDAKGCL